MKDPTRCVPRSFEPPFDRLKQAPAMQHRQHVDAVGVDFVDHPVAVQKALTHIDIAQFRHRAASPRMRSDHLAQIEQSVNYTLRVVQGVAGDELGDGVDVIDRLARPVQFGSHRARRSRACSVV